MTFSRAATLVEQRAAHTAALQPDCSVLIIGGVDLTVASDSERWVPGP